MYNMRLIIIKVNEESAGRKIGLIIIYALDNLKLTDYNFKL